MNIIKSIITLFKGKNAEQEVKQEPALQTIELKEPMQECFYCKEMIFKGDRWSKQQGKYFHKNCYKEALRLV